MYVNVQSISLERLRDSDVNRGPLVEFTRGIGVTDERLIWSLEPRFDNFNVMANLSGHRQTEGHLSFKQFI